jgi:hypothetical protein
VAQGIGPEFRPQYHKKKKKKKREKRNFSRELVITVGIREFQEPHHP